DRRVLAVRLAADCTLHTAGCRLNFKWRAGQNHRLIERDRQRLDQRARGSMRANCDGENCWWGSGISNNVLLGIIIAGNNVCRIAEHDYDRPIEIHYWR